MRCAAAAFANRQHAVREEHMHSLCVRRMIARAAHLGMLLTSCDHSSLPRAASCHMASLPASLWTIHRYLQRMDGHDS